MDEDTDDIPENKLKIINSYFIFSILFVMITFGLSNFIIKKNIRY